MTSPKKKPKRGQTSEHMRSIASSGGKATAQKPGHLKAIASLGGRARAKNIAARKGEEIEAYETLHVPPPDPRGNAVSASIDKMLAEIENW